MYERALGNERMLVVCNFCDHEVAFETPARYVGCNRVAANYSQSADGTLRPFECFALLRTS